MRDVMLAIYWDEVAKTYAISRDRSWPLLLLLFKYGILLRDFLLNVPMNISALCHYLRVALCVVFFCTFCHLQFFLQTATLLPVSLPPVNQLPVPFPPVCFLLATCFLPSFQPLTCRLLSCYCYTHLLLSSYFHLLL